jgi:hypothetical protein
MCTYDVSKDGTDLILGVRQFSSLLDPEGEGSVMETSGNSTALHLGTSVSSLLMFFYGKKLQYEDSVGFCVACAVM